MLQPGDEGGLVIVPEFLSELGALLGSTGKISGIRNVGNFCLFDLSNGLTVIGLPISSPTIEDAAEVSCRLKDAIEGLNTRYVVVTEDRWRTSRGMVQARLLAHAGNFKSVYARNCEVRRITRPEASEFLAKYHSYGSASGRNFYGLFLNRVGREIEDMQKGDLVAVSEFSNARRLKNGGGEVKSYEWIRHCSIPNLRISGGMGKILDHFIREIRPGDIMSYSDNEWSDGNVYGLLNFGKESQRPPVDFVIDPFTWQRTPLSRVTAPDDKCLYYRNLGSTKWRLRPVADHQDSALAED